MMEENRASRLEDERFWQMKELKSFIDILLSELIHSKCQGRDRKPDRGEHHQYRGTNRNSRNL